MKKYVRFLKAGIHHENTVPVLFSDQRMKTYSSVYNHGNDHETEYLIPIKIFKKYFKYDRLAGMYRCSKEITNFSLHHYVKVYKFTPFREEVEGYPFYGSYRLAYKDKKDYRMSVIDSNLNEVPCFSPQFKAGDISEAYSWFRDFLKKFPDTVGKERLFIVEEVNNEL